jgi:hypothetical protein
MKAFLIVAALLAVNVNGVASASSCSCNGCSCGPVCHAASELREHKPVRKAVAGVARGVVRVALFQLRALRGCE